MVPGVIGYIPEYRGVTRTPRRLLGLMGPSGGRGEVAKGQPRAPPPKSELDKEGGGSPLSFPPLSPSLSSPTPTWKGGVLLPVGVGLLMGRAKGGRPPPPPPLLYIRGRGAPHKHTS